MWRPGFEPDAMVAAEIQGHHRALCIRSTHYRGTAEVPGVVLGLAPGGSCTGRALGVTPERADEVIAYLDARELIGSYVYDRLEVQARRLDTEQPVTAWTYVARADHPDFLGDLPLPDLLHLIRQGHGLAGSNVDYVRSTAAHLREMGISDPLLDRVLAALDEGVAA